MINFLLLSVLLILMLLHAHTFPYPRHAFMVIHQNLQNKCSCHNSSFRMHFFRTDNRTLGKLDFFCKHGRIEACLSKLKLNNLNIPLFSQITFKQQIMRTKIKPCYLVFLLSTIYSLDSYCTWKLAIIERKTHSCGLCDKEKVFPNFYIIKASGQRILCKKLR